MSSERRITRSMIKNLVNEDELDTKKVLHMKCDTKKVLHMKCDTKKVLRVKCNTVSDSESCSNSSSDSESESYSKNNLVRDSKRDYAVTFDESESEEFTVVGKGINADCDAMNKAVETYDSWVPENKLQLRMKDTIDRIERKYCKKSKK
jgi:hypothetical protein